MNATGKSKPRKSMRVATIFTGVAAATVGMTQVATAQEVAHSAAKPASRHIARQMRPAIAPEFKYGSIRSSGGCAITDTGHPATHGTWLHLDWLVTSFGQSFSECYGYKGFIISPPGFGVTYECGGNNYGSLYGYSGTKEWNDYYTPGRGYIHLNKKSLYQVAIWSWTGNDTCGRA